MSLVEQDTTIRLLEFLEFLIASIKKKDQTIALQDEIIDLQNGIISALRDDF